MDEPMSIRKIAELAGVSVATVSRIINKKGRYSKETEKRVHEIMDEYGYVPNMLAKGLRTNRNMTIGIMLPDITTLPQMTSEGRTDLPVIPENNPTTSATEISSLTPLFCRSLSRAFSWQLP